MISRRAWLAGAAAGLGCGHRKATAYQGYCMVANRESRNVAAVDLARFTTRKHIALDAAPSAVVAHPTQPRAFVLAPDAGTVYEIDAVSLAVSRRVKAGNTAVAMRLGPNLDALWVLYRDPATLVELPLASLRPRRRIALAAPPDDFDFSSRNQAAIASRAARSITLASLERGAVERTLSVAAEPSLVRYRWDGLLLTTLNRPERSVTMLDVPSGKTVVTLPLPIEPRRICTNTDGWLFVDGDGMDAVVVIFPTSTEIWQTALAGRAPGAMAAAETKPPYLLVANPDSNTVTALDMLTQTLVAVIEVGERPGHILVTPDKQYALVLNEQSGDLAVIRLYSLNAASSERVLHYKSAPLFDLIPVGEKPVSAAVVNWT